MRCRRLAPLGIVALPLVIAAAGCHYIHFGPPSKFRTDARLASENADLRTEKKMLQEELAIARREGEVLRAAIDRPATASTGADELAAKLKATTRELADLRASYARLQAQRERIQPAPATDTEKGRFAAAEQIAELRGKLGETEDKLAEALRNSTQLQSETQQLRSSLQAARSENATLAQQLDHLTAQNDEARSALAQLNTEFLAQKEARAQAEQAMEALRAQLHAVTASAPAEPPGSLAAARETTAGGAREIEAPLHMAGLPDNVSAAASLSTSQAKLQAAGRSESPAASEAKPAPPPAPAGRTYTVVEGDSLEKISQKVYGRADRWALLYAANSAQLGEGRPLTPGMKLQVPEE